MNYTVVGAARSGLAAAFLAKRLGHNVFLTESKHVVEFKNVIEKIKEKEIDFEFGTNSELALDECDCIITSPGVPPSAWIIQEAIKRNIPIISELEFAWQHLKNNPFVAITGTNGKTTTTSLTEFIFNSSGRKAVSAGNIGKPLSSFVGEIDEDTIVVVEISSYQLDHITDFKPKVAIILNITPDHLSYHGNLENYINAKFKIAKNQDENDVLILNADDDILSNRREGINSDINYFSMKPLNRGIYKKGDSLYINYKHKEEKIMELNEILLPGVHNAYNSMAAALASRVFEIRNEDIRDSLMKFEGVEHRLEFVKAIAGVDYVNDSKATNINATWYALSSYNKPIIWIAGGRGDSNDYSELDKLVEKNVKCIVAIGEEANNIFNHFSTKVRCYVENTLEDAVRQAKENAEFDDLVLFTPACKSFDMFVNFEHRGEVFKEIVNSLAD